MRLATIQGKCRDLLQGTTTLCRLCLTTTKHGTPSWRVCENDGASAFTIAVETYLPDRRSDLAHEFPHGTSPVVGLSSRYCTGSQPVLGRDSNPLQTKYKFVALPNELPSGGKGGSRTHDLRFRKPMLFPLSYLPAIRVDVVRSWHTHRQGRAHRTGRIAPEPAPLRRVVFQLLIGACLQAPIRFGVIRRISIFSNAGKENAPGGKPPGAFVIHGRSVMTDLLALQVRSVDWRRLHSSADQGSVARTHACRCIPAAAHTLV